MKKHKGLDLFVAISLVLGLMLIYTLMFTVGSYTKQTVAATTQEEVIEAPNEMQ